MDNPFWDYAVAMYSREAVAQACLELQDSCGLDINLLLYAAWLGSLEQRLTVAHLQDMVTHIEPWRQRVVAPLRDLRRQLRGFSPARAIRQEVKELELRAEQQQQAAMYAFYRAAEELPKGVHPVGENLLLVTRISGCPGAPAESVLASLAAALTGVASGQGG